MIPGRAQEQLMLVERQLPKRGRQRFELVLQEIAPSRPNRHLRHLHPCHRGPPILPTPGLEFGWVFHVRSVYPRLLGISKQRWLAH
jgi:hypothetical protein